MRRALAALTDVMSCAFVHFMGGGVSYADPVLDGDGDALAFMLLFGVAVSRAVAEGVVPTDEAMSLMTRD